MNATRGAAGSTAATGGAGAAAMLRMALIAGIIGTQSPVLERRSGPSRPVRRFKRAPADADLRGVAWLMLGVALVGTSTLAGACCLRLSVTGTLLAAYVLAVGQIIVATDLLSTVHLVGRAAYLTTGAAFAVAALALWWRQEETVPEGTGRPAGGCPPPRGRGPGDRGRTGARIRTGARTDGPAEHLGRDDLPPDPGGGVAAARRDRVGARLDDPRQRLPGQRGDPDPVDARSRGNGCRERRSRSSSPNWRRSSPFSASAAGSASPGRRLPTRRCCSRRLRRSHSRRRPRRTTSPWRRRSRSRCISSLVENTREVAAGGDRSGDRARNEADRGLRTALPRARRAARPAAPAEVRRCRRSSRRFHRIRLADVHRQRRPHRKAARHGPPIRRGCSQVDARRDDLDGHADRLAFRRLHRPAHRPRHRRQGRRRRLEAVPRPPHSGEPSRLDLDGVLDGAERHPAGGCRVLRATRSAAHPADRLRDARRLHSQAGPVRRRRRLPPRCRSSSSPSRWPTATTSFSVGSWWFPSRWSRLSSPASTRPGGWSRHSSRWSRSRHCSRRSRTTR